MMQTQAIPAHRFTAAPLWKTTNAGVNWTLVNSGTTQSLFGVFFTNTLIGFACGNAGAIIRTTDGGDNWTVQTSPLNEILTDVWFTSANTGYISTWSGKVLKTSNGGFTFIEPISNEVPKECGLSQNYQNPFNPSTHFGIRIADFGMVTLKIYDILGNELETLVTQQLKPGTYEVMFNAENYSSGIYYYKLIAGSYIDTKKMVLIK